MTNECKIRGCRKLQTNCVECGRVVSTADFPLEPGIVLPPDRIEFFSYFIEEYNQHLKNGEIQDSYHCGVAVLLELQKLIFGIDDDEIEIR